ncbi:hypothetical protein Esti_002994 [Eimeria stiedai]
MYARTTCAHAARAGDTTRLLKRCRLLLVTGDSFFEGGDDRRQGLLELGAKGGLGGGLLRLSSVDIAEEASSECSASVPARASLALRLDVLRPSVIFSMDSATGLVVHAVFPLLQQQQQQQHRPRLLPLQPSRCPALGLTRGSSARKRWEETIPDKAGKAATARCLCCTASSQGVCTEGLRRAHTRQQTCVSKTSAAGLGLFVKPARSCFPPDEQCYTFVLREQTGASK